MFSEKVFTAKVLSSNTNQITLFKDFFGRWEGGEFPNLLALTDKYASHPLLVSLKYRSYSKW